MHGVIKKKTEKGFGFISGAELEKDLFFHSKALVGTTWDNIQEGQAVSFEVEDSTKGPSAINVTLV